jgi:hypothetical protein
VKKFFLSKIIIYLCFFYFISTISLLAESYKLGIKNYCNQVTIQDLLIDKLKIKYIEIKINNSRKWNKNILKAVRENDSRLSRVDIIEKKRKKKFKAKVILNYTNKKSCTFKSKIRLHGDLGDHIEFDQGFPITSMHVNLLEGNINNIVTFKLFLPKTRDYMNEIFITNFFKHLNFLSPRTTLFKVKINGKFYNYIFQEHITKELLESNNFVEGPILEGHEDMENKLANGVERLTRVSNFKWANKGKDELNSSIMAISYLNNITLMSNFYKLNNKELENIKNLIINPNISFGSHERNKKKYLAHEALMYALDASHGLSHGNRRFYYDYIYSSFLPIYYDGSSRLFTPHAAFKPNFYRFQKNSVNKLNKKHSTKFDKVLYTTKIGADIALSKMEEINIVKLKKELNISGFKISYKDLDLTLELIKERLKQLKTLEEYKLKKVNFKKPYYSFFRYKKKLNVVFFNREENNLYQCPISSSNIKHCSLLKNSNTKIPFFLNQKNSKIPVLENIFVGDNMKNYFSNQFIEVKNITSWKKYIIDDVSLVNYGKSLIEIDREKKLIIIKDIETSSRTVFFGGTLREWKIEYDGEFLGSKHSRKMNGLTGCLTFLDIEIKDIELNLKNSKCEDSVNFIRSKGSIKKAEIQNSSSDALDADFSDLVIKNIIIKNSKNDCLDFSFGKYKIKNAVLDNCGDKGISFGEQSIGIVNKIEINNSSIGVAAKDSSFVTIKNISSKFSDICLVAYRKKQEFYGSIILFNEMKCDSSTKFFAELGSNIKKMNLNEL